MNYLTWIKHQYVTRWDPLGQSAPADLPFVNLAGSGVSGGDAILAQYADHLRLDAPPGAGWRDGADPMWGHLGLRQQLAELFSLPSPDNVLTVAGGSQALFLSFTALRGRGGPSPLVAIEPTTYGPLFEIPAALGFRITPLDPDQPAPTDTFLAVLSNPNNPTGSFVTPAELRDSYLATLPPDAHALIDESFLSPADGHLSSATLRDPRIITVGGLTKPLGLGALRTGWIIAHGDTLDVLRDTWVQGFNIGSPLTESLAAAVLSDVRRHHVPLAARCRLNLETLTREFLDPLRSRGLVTCTTPLCGGIAFPRIAALARDPDPVAAAERFYDHLLHRHHVAVVPGRWFAPDTPGARATHAAHVRIAFGGPADPLRQGLSRLRHAIEQLHNV